MPSPEPRWSDLARILVGYSTTVRPGDRVLIIMQEADALPLTTAVYETVIRAGGLPHVQFNSSELERALLDFGSQSQLDWVPEPERAGMEWADVCIVLRGAPDPWLFASVPAARLATHRRALGVISGLRATRTRWVLCRVPGETWARTAGLTLDEAMDRYWAATLRDWPAAAECWSAIRDRLALGETVRVLGPGTNLAFSTRGRRWVVGDGHINMPDGEIYTAPLEDSVEGRITFSWPSLFGGQEVDGVRLEFSRGVVIGASATTNEALLQEALALDDGARRVGEVGVGVNDGIATRTGDILFDEKVSGTLHLALGRAYPECGGTNASALHWDLVTDLRHDGEIRLDGRPVFRNGAWLD